VRAKGLRVRRKSRIYERGPVHARGIFALLMHADRAVHVLLTTMKTTFSGTEPPSRAPGAHEEATIAAETDDGAIRMQRFGRRSLRDAVNPSRPRSEPAECETADNDKTGWPIRRSCPRHL